MSVGNGLMLEDGSEPGLGTTVNEAGEAAASVPRRHLSWSVRVPASRIGMAVVRDAEYVWRINNIIPALPEPQ